MLWFIAFLIITVLIFRREIRAFFKWRPINKRIIEIGSHKNFCTLDFETQYKLMFLRERICRATTSELEDIRFQKNVDNELSKISGVIQERLAAIDEQL